jgi:Spy/CpxP family protein refolding chaperone
MNDNQDTKQDSQPGTDHTAASRKRLRRWTLAGLAATAAGAFAFHRIAHAGGPGCGPGRFMQSHGPMDPETMGKFIDWRVSAMLSHVDASAEQKAKIGEIAKSAARELAPLREQHRAARDRAMALMVAPTIDRAALEKLRADELALAETLSKRAVQSLADAAEVLTPAQRQKLAQRWKDRHA